MSALVIAEPGCTHEGSYEAMVRLLKTAASCGASVWKPQWVSDPQLMCEKRHIPRDHPKRAYYEGAYAWLQFPLGWHAEFRDRCHALEMQYACTACLAQDVWALEPYVDYLKVSSFEARDATMQAACRYVNKPVIISTGLEDDVDDLANQWVGVIGFRLLHCVTSYPAPMASINLLAMKNEAMDGLSDHSHHLLTGALAATLGAHVIETHYRLDDCDPKNPDYAVAFTPVEFAQYITHIREAEVMLGDGVKRVHLCEEPMAPYRVVL